MRGLPAPSSGAGRAGPQARRSNQAFGGGGSSSSSNGAGSPTGSRPHHHSQQRGSHPSSTTVPQAMPALAAAAAMMNPIYGGSPEEDLPKVRPLWPARDNGTPQQVCVPAGGGGGGNSRAVPPRAAGGPRACARREASGGCPAAKGLCRHPGTRRRPGPALNTPALRAALAQSTSPAPSYAPLPRGPARCAHTCHASSSPHGRMRSSTGSGSGSGSGATGKRSPSS